MRSLTSEDHVVRDCKFHVIIVPKYRKKILFGPTRVQIGKIIRELAKQKDIEVPAGNACPDHMHLVFTHFA
jgi:putative transposase